MESQSDVSRSIIDDLHSSEYKIYQMEGESGVTRSIIDELHFSDIRRRSNGKLKWCYSKYHR